MPALVPGHAGGESDAVLGRWMAARGNPDELVIATNVGMKPDGSGFWSASIAAAAGASLGLELHR